MLRIIAGCTIAVAGLMFPLRLFAGGPPWLCLPLDGVTPGNVAACTEILTGKLEGKFLPWDGGIQLQQHAQQWYLTFYMGKPVALGEVVSALGGSGFSVPLDRLRLFGHVTLEIDARTAPRRELLADLNALPHVSVKAAEDAHDRFLVTVDMPYPLREAGGGDRNVVGWDTFQRNGLSSNQETEPRVPATPRQLPGYKDFADIVAKHQASLKDIRWSTNHVCRTLGCVAVAEPGAAVSPLAAWAIGRWNVTFSNGVVETCWVGDGGEASVEEPLRRSHGRAAANGGSIVLTFDDNRVERWTAVGQRLVVEHWFPASQFPAATPVLGIAESIP